MASIETRHPSLQFHDCGYEGARGLLRVGRRQVGYLGAHPRSRSTRIVYTHASTQVTGHDLPGSLSVRLPLVALLLDAVRRLPRSWPDYGATESDGTGQWESNRDAGEPGAGPSDGIDTLPPKDSDGTNFIFSREIVHILCL